MRKKTYLFAALYAALLLSGCGAAKSDYISAGMEQVKTLEYDSALESFAAAREAGEDERLVNRGEGLAYMGKTMYAEAAQAFESALSGSSGRVSALDYDINSVL